MQSSPSGDNLNDEGDASISLNVHVVPPITEGQDVSRQSTFTSIDPSINDAAVATNTMSDESFLDLGASEDIVPFFDDLLSQFTGGFNDWSNPQGSRPMPPILE